MQLKKIKLIGDETSVYTQVTTVLPAVARPVSGTWGWLPVLSLTSAVGVFLIALAAEAGRLASNWADQLFWLGLLVLFVPVAVRMISPQPARRERIALIALLGGALYLLRYLEQPLAFAYNDEFLQWRTALNISTSGHLFLASPLLPINGFYPGLQIVTIALSSLTGLSLFASGIIIIDVAGLVFMLALYLFFEYLSASARVAGIAALLYMAKPSFFADTLYHYEDLAMPLMAFVLFVIAYRSYEPKGRRRIGLSLAIWLGLAVVVVTHHVTSYMLDTFLFIWTAAFILLRLRAFFLKNNDQKAQLSPGLVAFLGIALNAIWVAYTSGRSIAYLYPILQATTNQFVQIFNGQAAARQFFHDAGGYVEPLWERLTAYAAVGLICVGLPFGLIQLWRRYRANAAVIALAVVALAYPLSQLIRLTSSGVNLSARLQPYLFVSAAFVLAVGITHFWLSRAPGWKSRMLLTGAIAIIFIGGWVTGTSPAWNRLPGPYTPYSDQRSIQPESVTAAEWAGSYLGSGQRMISDQVNTILMATYGKEWVVTTANDDQIIVASVFSSAQFDSGVEASLRLGRVQYIVVDRRLIGVDQAEYPQPVDAEELAKFDGVPDVSRVFDSGNIVIYNVELITSGSSTSPPPPPAFSCKPASSTGVSVTYPNLSKAYTGTFYDIPHNVASKISLTSIQQQRGNICGYFSGTVVAGSFKGTMAANGQIQFTVTGKSGQALYTFEGSLTPDGLLVGSYCVPGQGTGQCSDYGLWSVAPAKSG